MGQNRVSNSVVFILESEMLRVKRMQRNGGLDSAGTDKRLDSFPVLFFANRLTQQRSSQIPCLWKIYFSAQYVGKAGDGQVRVRDKFSKAVMSVTHP